MLVSKGERRHELPKERKGARGHLENGTVELSTAGLLLWNLQENSL